MRATNPPHHLCRGRALALRGCQLDLQCPHPFQRHVSAAPHRRQLSLNSGQHLEAAAHVLQLRLCSCKAGDCAITLRCQNDERRSTLLCVLLELQLPSKTCVEVSLQAETAGERLDGAERWNDARRG
jgi:hypothetical protein